MEADGAVSDPATGAAMPRTLIVSNRLPCTIVTGEDGTPEVRRSGGGLVSAMLPVHARSDSLWLGYAGQESPPHAALVVLAHDRLHHVAIPDQLYTAYYNGEANAALWPLFHYFPSLASFDPAHWRAYQAVNERFAEAVAAVANDGDLVWVHDYQLMLLPALLRQRLSTVRIGYFHHIPFPASEVLKLHPAREALLDGLLGADFVGFHTLEYARHFVGACERLLGMEASADEVLHAGHAVRAGALPLGIDTQAIATACASTEHARFRDELRTAFAGRRLLLGVDRLDYTKGIRERLNAFSTMLRRHESLRGQAVLVQLCVPTREDVERYAELRAAIERQVGRINGEFGRPGYTPVEYLYRSVPLEQLTALYATADACLVTPLRDGLNLVCKEYVAARADLGGMLVLSEFAGAADEMGEALIVNPLDQESTADAMAIALTMPAEERATRMATLRERVLAHDNRRWAERFISTVDELAERRRAGQPRILDRRRAGRLAATLRGGTSKPLLAIDIDLLAGALLDQRWERGTRDALRTRLADLATEGRCTVVLLSGRSRGDCERVLPAVAGAWLVAEHGCWLRVPGSGWTRIGEAEDLGPLRERIVALLSACAQRIPRSRLEADGANLAWRFREIPSSMAQSIARETSHALNQLLSRTPWSCVLGRTGIEIRPLALNAGTALTAISAYGVLAAGAQVVSIGDASSDDALFRFRGERNLAITITVNTPGASWLIPRRSDVPGVLQALFPATAASSS